MKFLTRQEELIMLAIYQSGGESSLVKVRDYIIKNTGKEWSISSVYVPLDRLTRTGYLRTSIGEPEARRGGKAVKYYQLTQDGLAALTELKTIQDVMWKGITKLAVERK